MTEQEHLEISRDLALAIGWKPEQIKDCKGYILVGGGLFDYRDEVIAFRVAERYNAWPTKFETRSGYWAMVNDKDVQCADTPQLAIALAVIAEQGVK